MTDDVNDLDAFAYEPSLHAPKKSLAISPNLEALLAHDERTRTNVPKLSDLSDPHSHYVLSSFSGSVEPQFANTLPPPPRGNRRLASRPITPLDAPRSTSLHRPRTLSGTLPNPYLNEIPKLPRLDPLARKKGDALDESSTLRSPLTTVTSPTAVTSSAQDHIVNGILEAFCGDPPRRPSLPTSPNRDLHHSISGSRSVERRNSVGTRPYTTLPRVDKFLGKGRSIFSRHGDREEVESTLLNPSVSAKRHISGGANDEKKHQKSATTALGSDKHIASHSGSSSISPRPSLEYKSGVKRPVPPHASRSWHPSMSSQPKLTRPSSLPRADATDPINWSGLANSPERLRLDPTNPLPYISASSQLVAPDSLSLPPTSPRFSTAPEASSESSYTTLLSATITPKPALYRHSSGSPLSPKRKASPTPMSRLVRQGSPKPAVEAVDATVPPTTNFLNAQARADLVKKSRKLAKVFGATPGALAVANQDDFHITSFPPIIALPNRHRRGAASVANITTPPDESGTFSPWSIVEGQMSGGRRHSTPDELSFLNVDDISPTSGGRDDGDPESPLRFRPSFMSLSDDDLPTPSPSPQEDEAAPRSPSATSIASTIMEQDDEEVDRRRKRERLAKLHRFLGSHVPAELVFGIRPSDETSLPSPASLLGAVPEDDSRKAWKLRRRSSSVLPLEDIERRKEELNTEEKALKVRRALKMEKVFGVPPPRSLYSRETTSSPSSPRSSSQPPSPAFRKNPNQSAYKGKTHRRIPTSDSTQRLIPSRSSGTSGLTSVYSHFQHSITTLNDIIDRDDRASLAELHQYLQGDEPQSSPDDVAVLVDLGSPTSLKSDRRLSLPSSILSASTADSSTRPEANDFQLRRRRAAKLSQFFGADYKSVMQEVLDSIEKGVEDERQSGHLQPEEAEALFQKLRLLKKKKLTTNADL
ncbi:hypothetical protein FIBSPDRAFT_238012 [Athelia psychrophila]|uniref:Uncharacterized protein n=1 Tax=Athelia psychrophila TaxID=1759441 RepID=A0A166S2Y0_9AGAM|nr:hypothetical protein FIBSPDRAFT_238012 [Fibularhizoctonia sp. CBS 109695]